MAVDYSDLADEFEPPADPDGDGKFAPTFEFTDETPILKGTYRGSKQVKTANGMRTKHIFRPADGFDDKGVEIWGSKVLDEDLPDVTDTRCAVVWHGKIRPASGNPFHKYEVLRAKGAVAAPEVLA